MLRFQTFDIINKDIKLIIFSNQYKPIWFPKNVLTRLFVQFCTLRLYFKRRLCCLSSGKTKGVVLIIHCVVEVVPFAARGWKTKPLVSSGWLLHGEIIISHICRFHLKCLTYRILRDLCWYLVNAILPSYQLLYLVITMPFKRCYSGYLYSTVSCVCR